MNCKECRKLLDDYHDGELDEKRTSAMERHIAECRACAAELAILKSEEEIFEHYRVSQQSEIADPARNWDALRNRIADTSEHARRPRRADVIGPGWMRLFIGSPLLRQAAFAVVLVAVSVSATLWVVSLNRAKAPAPVVSHVERSADPAVLPVVDATNTGLESAMVAVRRAEREYIQAIQLLSEIVDRRMPSLDPALAVKFRKHLKAIDDNIAETRKAYYERPSDPELAQFMLSAYSKKVELLQQMVT
jgi:DNA-binding transcriptional MerR regulator